MVSQNGKTHWTTKRDRRSSVSPLPVLLAELDVSRSLLCRVQDAAFRPGCTEAQYLAMEEKAKAAFQLMAISQKQNLTPVRLTRQLQELGHR